MLRRYLSTACCWSMLTCGHAEVINVQQEIPEGILSFCSSPGLLLGYETHDRQECFRRHRPYIILPVLHTTRHTP